MFGRQKNFNEFDMDYEDARGSGRFSERAILKTSLQLLSRL